MTKEFLESLATVIRDQVIMKNSVQINGLGTFKPEHKNQRKEKTADGSTKVYPPVDVLTFTPE